MANLPVEASMERVPSQTTLKSLIVLLLFLLCSAQSSFATTVITPSDDDMVIGARAILRGKVVAIESSFDAQTERIYTYITIKVQEVLKGQITERRVVLKELGGQVGDRTTVIYGNPQFKKGEKVLLYLDTWADGSLRTYQMFLGKFNIVRDDLTGREVAVRSSPDENTTVLKNQMHGHRAPGRSTERQELSRYIRMVKNRLAANWERSVQFEAEAYANIPLLGEPPEYRSIADRGEVSVNFTFLGPFRFFEPDSGQPVAVTLNPNPSSDQGVPQVTLNSADVIAAGNAWSNVSGCALQMSYSGALNECYSSGALPGVHVVSNNCDGRNAPTPGCASILAWGGVRLTGSQTKVINGTTFRQTIQGFVSMNPWASCSFNLNCNVQEILTHEIGHAIGLGHSQFSDATMAAFAHFDGRCASIRTDDADGVRAIYPGSGGGGGPLTVTTSTLAGGTVGSSYSQNLNASGGTPPYSWIVVAGLGTLPSGLNLSGGGAITGTPTAAGTYNFTVRVTDNIGGTAQKALSIVIGTVGAAYNSQFVSQNVPTTLQPGQTFTVNMRFQNTGTQTWSGTAFYFASQNPALNQTWGGNGVSLAGFVAGPGELLNVDFTATAPIIPGTYNFQWQMYQNGGVGFFGQMSTNVAIQVGSASTDGAGFVSQTVSTSMIAGHTYSVSVTMANTGTTTWAAGTYYLGSINPQGNTTWGLNRVNVAAPVAPGANASFSFNVTAPVTTGNHNFQWQMAKDAVGFFGSGSTNLVIGVSAANKHAAMIDIDNDGKADLGFSRNGLWGFLKSSQGYSLGSAQFFSWGGSGLPPIMADFDGDEKGDLAYVVPPSGGQSATYAILKSSTNYDFPQAQFVPAGFPSLGDTPVVGDFDGDGKDDPGIWRASQGVWIVPQSSSNYTSYLFSQWGQSGDTPIVADFDGDGKADVGFYRNGLWGFLKSSQGYSLASAQFFSWGGAGLAPIVADFDGDGKADLAYVAPPSGGQSAAYSILRSSTGYSFDPGQVQFVPAGFPSLGDTPRVADFDGDGKADPGIWRASQGVWIVPLSSTNYASYIFAQWGQSGDVALPGTLTQY